MTAASPEILEKGGDSVIHSSISSANEYVSEYVVMGKSFCLMSSGAAYLIIVADDTVFDTVVSWVSWMILAIPKSQIWGSSFQAYR